MINIIFNAQTGDKTIEELPDVELAEISAEPTAEDRINNLEMAILEMEGII